MTYTINLKNLREVEFTSMTDVSYYVLHLDCLTDTQKVYLLNKLFELEDVCYRNFIASCSNDIYFAYLTVECDW